MLTVEYGFRTSVKRSGHAACWSAALGGLVQFGGWPPSDQLTEVMRHEASGCPLYVLPITTIARHMHRADQRNVGDSFDAALSSHRQRRLRRLCGTTHEGTVTNSFSTLAEPGVAGIVASGQHSVANDAPSANVGSADAVSATGTPETSTFASSTTDEVVSTREFQYDEGYVSELVSEEGTANDQTGSDTDVVLSSSEMGRNATLEGEEPSVVPAHTGAEDVAAPIMTVELLRQLAEETEARLNVGSTVSDGVASVPSLAETLHDNQSASPRTRAGYATATLLDLAKSGSTGRAAERETAPLQKSVGEVRGKSTVRPLRWNAIRPRTAPRTRHGHHLVACGALVYVIGGSYWAHGNALASSDMMYDTRTQVWHQISSLLPQRFCAALAASNAVPPVLHLMGTQPAPQPVMEKPVTSVCSTSAAAESVAPPVASECQVLYYFGGLNYSFQLTNSLHRLWLPQEVLEELPQYGAVPREQFKGVLVCDVQRECTPEERRGGKQAVGRLFYMDGFQSGRPMVPYLRVYSLATGVWVRVCPSPDLIRSQVSLLQYRPVDEPHSGGPLDADTTGNVSHPGQRGPLETSMKRPFPAVKAGRPMQLARFEVVGGMPSRRGRQRRSRMCYSFDVLLMHFDYSYASPVPGLTAHCVVLLPDLDPPTLQPYIEPRKCMIGTATDRAASPEFYETALSLLLKRYGVRSVCCGGNEDIDQTEQNSLGSPVGWLYLLIPRRLPLREVARVQMNRLRISSKILTRVKDDLLEELF